MVQRIDVTTPDGGSYPIVIAVGLLHNLAAYVDAFSLSGSLGVITNMTLDALYGEALRQQFPHAVIMTMPDGEPFKTLETTADLYRQMVAGQLDRSSIVLAFGGGVVGDTAGFAAATYMRGLRLLQMPTSLLAMVDSSVGGKVGVDLTQGKNLVGAFKQPAAVLVDPSVLQTLPVREWRCGLAEVIKHGLIADPGLIDALPSAYDVRVDMEAVLARAVQVKVAVVQADPYERGIRAHLNLGHTFGHAIEIVSEFRWQHGEAVALGLIAAARLSHRLGLCAVEVVERVEAAVASAGLPTQMGDLDPDRLWLTMGTDKKWRSGQPRFVLLRAIGQVDIIEGVARDAVLAVLESLRGQSTSP